MWTSNFSITSFMSEYQSNFVVLVPLLPQPSSHILYTEGLLHSDITCHPQNYVIFVFQSQLGISSQIIDINRDSIHSKHHTSVRSHRNRQEQQNCPPFRRSASTDGHGIGNIRRKGPSSKRLASAYCFVLTKQILK